MPTAECSLPFDELRHEEKAMPADEGPVTVPPFVIYTFLSFPYFSGGTSWQILEHRLCIPIGSMYGIYTNTGGILMVNVTIYSIHGSYGIVKINGGTESLLPCWIPRGLPYAAPFFRGSLEILEYPSVSSNSM